MQMARYVTKVRGGGETNFSLYSPIKAFTVDRNEKCKKKVNKYSMSNQELCVGMDKTRKYVSNFLLYKPIWRTRVLWGKNVILIQRKPIPTVVLPTYPLSVYSLSLSLFSLWLNIALHDIIITSILHDKHGEHDSNDMWCDGSKDRREIHKTCFISYRYEHS